MPGSHAFHAQAMEMAVGAPQDRFVLLLVCLAVSGVGLFLNLCSSKVHNIL